MFYSFDWTDLHVDIPGKPPSSIARWTKILFFFLPTSHRDTSAKLRYYLQFTFIYLLLVFVNNVHLFSCNHWYLHLPDPPTISLCAFDNMLQKSSDHLLPCPFFKNEKRKQSAMSTRLLHQTFPTGYYAFHRHTQRLSNEPPSLRNFGLLLKIALALGSSTHTPFLPIARYKSNIEKVTIVSDYISFFLQFLRCL